MNRKYPGSTRIEGPFLGPEAFIDLLYRRELNGSKFGVP
jgi:hypothetical protein